MQRDKLITAEEFERMVNSRQVFLSEYDEARHGTLVCRVPRRVKSTDRVTALPWQHIPAIPGLLD